MPTHRKASVAHSHPGRKPRREAAGHLLVQEGTVSWAPWIRPTLTVSPICTLTTLLQLLCNTPHPRAGFAPGLKQALCCRGCWGGQQLGLESFSPFGDRRAITSLVTSLCSHSLSTNYDRTVFSPSCTVGHCDAGRLREGWGSGHGVLSAPVESTGAASSALPRLVHLAGKP